MKYIRTKDGRIIDLVFYKEEGLINGGIKFVNKLNGSYFFVQQDNIAKQADTIEELCDDFVLYENSHCCIIGDIEAKEMATTNYGIIYGAIWTKWGLKYVAKFNDKGELELL